MSKKDIILMAIAAGKETTEGNINKKYMGLAACTLVAINPTKAELAHLLGNGTTPANIEKEPEYTAMTEQGIATARIDLYLKTIPEKSNNIETIIRVTYFLRDEKRFNTDKTKVQIINAYGDTAWVTQEEFKNKKAPSYQSEFSLNAVRPAFVGEEDLVKFIKKFLNIPNLSYRKADGTIVYVEDKSLAECQLSEVKSYFSNNFKEIKTALSARPNNKVKLLFGVKTSQDNKLYQDCFSSYPINYAVNNYDYLTKNLLDRKSNGGYPNTDFGKAPYIFTEYNVNPSVLTPSDSRVPNSSIDTNFNFDWNTQDDFPADN